jgi:hypothetical protein
MRKIVMMSMMMSLVLVGVASASDGSASALQPIVDELVQLLAAGVAALVLYVCNKLAQKLKEKWSIETDLLEKKRVEKYAAYCASWAEEKAAQAAKDGDLAMKGEDKLRIAAARLVAKLGISQDAAEEAIEAALPFLAMGAVWALRKAQPSQSPQE